MNRPGVRPPTGGWLPWVIWLVALLVGALSAGLAKMPGLAAGLAIAAVVVPLVVTTASTAIRGRLEQRAKIQASARELTAGAQTAGLLVRDLSASRAGVHRSVRDDVDYIARDLQQDARRDRRHV